jgi:hypothetical protein
MSLSTYSELQSAIGDWLNRADLSAVIPQFIKMAEARFNRELRVREMLLRAEAVSDAEYLVLPSDWLETYSLEMVVTATTTAPPLSYIGINEAKILKANHIQNDPRYYTMVNNFIELIPAPKGDQDLLLTYYQKIPALSESNPTNWLLTKSPDLYLYASLLQAAPYLKNDERIQVWAAGMTDVMDKMQMDSEKAMRPATALAARRRGFM